MARTDRISDRAGRWSGLTLTQRGRLYAVLYQLGRDWDTYSPQERQQVLELLTVLARELRREQGVLLQR